MGPPLYHTQADWICDAAHGKSGQINLDSTGITTGAWVGIDRSGLPGHVINWSDPLHDGPVPAGLSLSALSRIRERFPAGFFDLPLSQVSFAERDRALTDFRAHEDIALWFEHGLYDQLQLVQTLD